MYGRARRLTAEFGGFRPGQTLNISWGYYVSSEGNPTVTILPNGTKETHIGQASGAYMFRPDDQFTHACSQMQPTLGARRPQNPERCLSWDN